MKTWNSIKIQTKLMILITLCSVTVVVAAVRATAGIHYGFLTP